MKQLVIWIVLAFWLVHSHPGAAQSFKVVTYNTWGLRTALGDLTCKDLDDRFAILPDELAETGADILLLQEVWDDNLADQLVTGLRRHSFHHVARKKESSPIHSFASVCAFLLVGESIAEEVLIRRLYKANPAVDRRSLLRWLGFGALNAGRVGALGFGAEEWLLSLGHRSLGNGLLILSKFPLDPNVRQLTFSTATIPLEERWIIKGALLTRVWIPGLGWTDLGDTHLGAITFDLENNRFHPAQSRRKLIQGQELFEFFRDNRLSPQGIYGGDWNTDFRPVGGETGQEYRWMTDPPPQGLGMIDVYRHFHNDAGYTDANDNPYRVLSRDGASPPRTIDYLFASLGNRLRLRSSRLVFNTPPLDRSRILQDRALPPRLSDHSAGIEAIFDVR